MSNMFEPLPWPGKDKQAQSQSQSPNNYDYDDRAKDNGRGPKEGRKKPTIMPLPVVRVWEQSEPPPRTWAIEGLVPDGVITTLFGDGGMGKSYIAMYWAILSCLGRPFGNRHMEQRVALYIDGELDAAEFERRAYKIARGMGLSGPPEGLHYTNLPGSIKDPIMQERCRLTILGVGAGITILDSLTVASYGSDPKEAQDVIEVMTGLKGWGTVVALDHITKVVVGSNLSNYSQFGSAFKKHLARSSIKLIQAPGGGISLQNDKANFGPKSPPMFLAMDWGEDSVGFRHVDAEDASMAGIGEHLPAIEQVHKALMEQEGWESSPQYLADYLGKKVGTIKNYLTALHKQGRVTFGLNGTWVALSSKPPDTPS